MKNNTIHIMYIAIILVLLVAVAGEYYYFHTKALRMGPVGYAQMGMYGNNKNGTPRGMGKGGMMMQVTPPALSDQQQQQLTDGTSTATTKKTFNITGGDFYFRPNTITVNKGDEVTFIMTNAGGIHDLVISELGVKTPVIRTGNAATATFTASKTGSFIYFCDVMGHRQKGMWGTLTVK